jgi:heterodisulfide reductase subunit A
LEGEAGKFKAKVLKKARYVDIDKCTGCGDCIEKCPTKDIPNQYEQGLNTRKAIYMEFLQAVPRAAIIDPDNCRMLTENKCGVCAKVCQRDAIDYEMKDEVVELDVASVVVATGFDLWDPSEAPEYGYGKIPNVYMAMEYERLINAAGPTGGHITRRSDGKEPDKIAFIQCVGSRNLQLGHPYCCAVCCMHSTKEAMLAREHYDNVKSTIFYKDMRACAKGFNEYVERAKRDYDVEYINSDGTIQDQTPEGNPIVSYDVHGQAKRQDFDIVVLASTLLPNKTNPELAKVLGVELDEFGFIKITDNAIDPVSTTRPGVFAAGYCSGPADIPESVAMGSAAASKAAVEIVRAG